LVGQQYAQQYKGWIWCAGAASAEFLADIALCPMEMVKVKVQTSVPGTFPTAFAPAFTEMNMNRHITRFPYGSIVPLWSRQIPYTVAKFYTFEKVLTKISFSLSLLLISDDVTSSSYLYRWH
jgi:solute carrier family 25 phosphate transporter 3